MRSGAQFRHAQIEILSVVHKRRFAPRAFEHFHRFRHTLAAVVAAQTMTDEFIFVVDGAFADANVDTANRQLSSSASCTARRIG